MVFFIPFFPTFICFLIWIVLFIIWIFVCYWVYKDAEKRGMNGALWFLIVFLASLIGLIVYFIVREEEIKIVIEKQGGKKESDRRCPNCGRVIPEDAVVCPYCAKKF